jgi:hypothetical protein
MAGPIIVQGPDGQEYEFPEGTSPDVMKQAMQKRYGAPKQTAIPDISRPDPNRFPPQPGLEGPAVNQNILPGMGGGQMGVPQARPTYEATPANVAMQAQNALKAEQDAARIAAQAPVAQAAEAAGRQAMTQGLSDTPAWAMGLGGPAATLAGQSAYETEYNKAGVVSPPAAMEMRGLNSVALGLPGLLNEDIRNRLGQAGQDQPGASMIGDIAGYLVPSEAAWQMGRAATNALARPLISRVMPQGSGALSRTARVTGRGATLAAAGSGQGALYQGLVGESVAAGEEGRDPSLESMAERAVMGGTDPVAVLALPAVMGVNRLLTWVRSGGATATPARIADEVSAATGGRSNPPQSAASQVLDMDLAGADIRPQAIDRVVRTLRKAGMSSEDITGLFESVQQRLSSLPEAQASRLTLGQALLEALENPELSRAAGAFPQAAFNLRQVLRGAAQGGRLGEAPRTGDQRAGIVSGVRRELQGSQTDFAQRAIDDALGDTSLISIDDLVAGAKREIGAEYERVLQAADSGRPEARGIAMIVMGDSSAPGILGRRAKNAGFESVEAYVAAMPDAAGHWMRSSLAKAARSAKGREKIELETTVAQLDELLETNAGYAAARKAYGTEMGVDEATEFGNRFIASSKNEYSVDLLMRELAGMSERERAVALASIRNNLRSYLRGSQEEASAKISQLTNVGALNALEQLGAEGQSVANALRFLRREQGFLGNTIYGSDTFRNMKASEAEALGNTAISNVAQGQGGMFPAMATDAVVSAASQNPTAIFTPLRMAGNALANIGRPRVSTLNDEARFLLSRRGNVPDLPQSGRADFSTPSPNALAPDAPPIRAGGLVARGDVSSALAYGGVGGFSGNFMDYNQDGVKDAQDMAIGAGIGAAGAVGLNRAGRMLPKSQAERLAATQDIPQAAAVMAEKFKPRKITRGATDADWEEASKEAFDLLKAQAAKQDGFEPGARVWNEKAPESLTDPNAPPRFVYEDLAAQILRSRGIDPDPVYGRMLSERPSNAETERMGKLIGYEAGNARAAARAAELDEADPWEGTLNYLDDLSSDKTRLNSFAPGSDMMNALAGAGLGGIAPADSAEERARNMAIGAGLGGGARRVGKAFGSEADGAVRSAGAGGKRPPKPDSPEAIKAALKDMAKDQKEPTRLERMVDDGRDAAVPPANPTPHPDDKVAQQAQRMLDRGMSPIEVYDKTRIAFVPYNGGNVPVLSPSIGPEELTRKFYAWMARPPRERPEWVRHIMRSAPPKKGMMLTDRAPAPPRQNALVEPPVDDSIPWGGIGVGAGAGLLTGVPAGILAGTAYARNQDRKRNALAE